MSDTFDQLVEKLRGRGRGRKRAEHIVALLQAKTTDGAIFGVEGKLVADIIEDALATAVELPPKKKKVDDTGNHQAAAGILKHIENTYETAFNGRYDCNYGWHVPMLRRLLDKGETVDGLKHLAEAWISAGRNELVTDNYTNSRIWGDATIKAFVANLNIIKSHAIAPATPEKKWVMAPEASQ